MPRLTTLSLIAVLLLGCSVFTSTAEAPRVDLSQPPKFVGLWVTRWDFKRPEHIRQIMADARSAGVTDVFFQVRGQADALYPSELEPWSELLLEGLPDGATDPGFDPLAVAIDAAHQRGMKLHAWVNVMSMWKGKTPPRDRRHVFYTHPEWRLKDTAGKPQPLSDHYTTINPVLTATHKHILAVVDDIVTRYAVDGVHLDYIRFITESAETGAGYPADRVSHAMFTASTGQSATADRAAYDRFIADRITSLVETISTGVKAKRPDAMVSAAVWRNPQIAEQNYMQRYADWMREGYVDAVMPMVYTDDNEQFKADMAEVLAIEGQAVVIAGVGLYKHEQPSQTVRQMAHAHVRGADGVCLFAYSSLFESVSSGQDKSDSARALRKMRLNIVRAYLRGRLSDEPTP